MTVARYDEFAEWYTAWVRHHDIQDFVADALMDAVGDPRGERLLDVGCGEGRIARRLASRGNAVVGVDVSDRLLDFARLQPAGDVEYLSGDACSTSWWDGKPFDGAVSSMALIDIDDLAGVIRAVATVLRPGGWFAWSIVHPAFPGTDAIQPSWSPSGGYFVEGWWNTGGDGVRGRVGSNHRTLATYLNAMLASGFTLEAVAEPPWSPETGAPPLPFFLVARWRRVAT